MKVKSKLSIKSPDILFLSLFGVGFSPYAPGTMGTLATVPFLYFIGKLNPPFFIFIPFIVVLTIIAIFIAESTQQRLKLHDPSWIVIDEVLGISVAWLFIVKHNMLHLAIITLLFRIFDIFKVWPATYFDKQVTHGLGTIVDDIISGIYAGLVYLLIAKFML